MHGDTKPLNDELSIGVNEQDDLKSLEATNKYEASLSDHFRHVMRTVPNPLAIITSCRPGIERWEESSVGALVNSLTSVSIKDEDVLVSFNLKQGSTTFQAISTSKQFAVTFPGNDAGGAALARIFTMGNDPPLFSGKDTFLQRVNTQDSAKANSQPPPIVTFKNKSKGVSAMSFGFVCELASVMEHGDHVIVVGKVLPGEIYTGYQDAVVAKYDQTTPFQTSQSTLPYIHGQYAHPQFDAGVNNCWKYDDKYLGRNFKNKSLNERNSARDFYVKRLKLLEKATEAIDDPSIADWRARRLSIGQIEQYSDYYQRRLDEVKTRSTEAETTSSQIVKQKANLSSEALQQEEEVFSSRLSQIEKSLSSIEGQLSSMANRAEGTRTVDGEPTQETLVAKMNELLNNADYIEERLYLIGLAKTSKQTQQTRDIEKTAKTARGHNSQIQHGLKRFIGTKRGASIEQLQHAFRRYAYGEAESMLLLMQAESQSEVIDGATLEQLQSRTAFNTSRKAAMELLLRERWSKRDPAEVQEKLFLPLHWKAPINEAVDKDTEHRHRINESILLLKDD